ncbi:hypothetical protein GOBAR_AA16088 [Gossypium barbadense]|uniref:Uncharacterized protein n=1 Tax=Gossypium barbadense TaxID=3634 RepID=A0A2P5XMJ3_GOSBA|nr:hypothetical protein GOBAR_AA16088 [Gossypium barbadense]
MNGLLDLELWRIISQGNDEIKGAYSSGGRGWFHNHGVQGRSYRGSRTGHGSRGEPFPALELFITVIESGTSLRIYIKKHNYS